ncbi:hypothetical protein [Mesorhizobium sp. B2-4-18]|uniref:alpha/beta fold hydrolase n=1 Tax=Mesorhizobium sp. B2-4-18 TaxID=2589931 RepID=UPI001FEE03A8|nr:hypothetical protein [Mesorhizobium sp. B2-4-18]
MLFFDMTGCRMAACPAGGKAHLLDKSGHAPFWDSPGRFNPIFARFLESVDQA